MDVAPSQFTDNARRSWTIALDVGLVKHVKDRLGVDLIDWGPETGEGQAAVPTVFRLAADPVLLVDVLWLLCAEQAAEREVDDVAFGRAMAGDAIGDATDALLEATVRFFPSRKRAPLEKAVDRLQELETKAAEVAVQALDDPELDRRIAALGTPSSTSPASAASSPGGTRSASSPDRRGPDGDTTGT